MIVIMREAATGEEIEDLQLQLKELGLDSRISGNGERKVLLVLGDTRKADLETTLAGHPASERVVAVLPQRRYERLFSRRNFLDVFMCSLASLFALLAAGATALFLQPSGEKRTRHSVMKVASEEDFKRRPYRIVDDRGQQIIVVRTAHGDYHALSATCTHSEICQVEWSAPRQELQCPCHRAAFDVQGNVLHGPPPRPLGIYSVEVIDKNVYLKLHS